MQARLFLCNGMFANSRGRGREIVSMLSISTFLVARASGFLIKFSFSLQISSVFLCREWRRLIVSLNRYKGIDHRCNIALANLLHRPGYTLSASVVPYDFSRRSLIYRPIIATSPIAVWPQACRESASFSSFFFFFYFFFLLLIRKSRDDLT